MPLGNLTSQFFANVYLNELDYFIKHKLKIKYYIRYVDDFIVLDKSENKLELLKLTINTFLKEKLDIELHPEKSRIFSLEKGTDFLGFRIYPHHKLLRKNNFKRFKSKFKLLCLKYEQNLIDYDKIYDFIEGWIAYSKNANTYKLRMKILNEFEEMFSKEISTKETNRILRITD